MMVSQEEKCHLLQQILITFEIYPPVATLTGVAIRGVISITVKMVPQK